MTAPPSRLGFRGEILQPRPLVFLRWVMTAARSAEVRLPRWQQTDLQTDPWTVPAERMKANPQHRVPLSSRARADPRVRSTVARWPDPVADRGGRPRAAEPSTSVRTPAPPPSNVRTRPLERSRSHYVKSIESSLVDAPYTCCGSSLLANPAPASARLPSPSPAPRPPPQIRNQGST